MFRYLRSLFQRFEPRTIHDENLGALTNDAHGDWNGRLRLSATSSDIDVSLRTGDAPPNENQIQFVRDAEMRFPSIWQELSTSLFADLDDFADGTTTEQLFDSLKIDFLWFYQLKTRPFEWEMSCTTPLDDHIFGIVMEGFENRGFRMDG